MFSFSFLFSPHIHLYWVPLLSLFVCWFQPGLISQPTVFFSHSKSAPAGLISPEINQRIACTSLGGVWIQFGKGIGKLVGYGGLGYGLVNLLSLVWDSSSMWDSLATLLIKKLPDGSRSPCAHLTEDRHPTLAACEWPWLAPAPAHPRRAASKVELSGGSGGGHLRGERLLLWRRGASETAAACSSVISHS